MDFLLGMVVGFVLAIVARNLYQRVVFLFLLHLATKAEQYEREEAIKEMERYVNSQDWNDDD